MSTETESKREIDHGTCYCGKPANKTSSGTRECWSCWKWRKMDEPAATYWTRVIEQLFKNGPDTHDVMTWTKWGIAEQVGNALATLRDMQKRYQEELDAHSGK